MHFDHVFVNIFLFFIFLHFKVEIFFTSPYFHLSTQSQSICPAATAATTTTTLSLVHKYQMSIKYILWENFHFLVVVAVVAVVSSGATRGGVAEVL